MKIHAIASADYESIRQYKYRTIREMVFQTPVPATEIVVTGDGYVSLDVVGVLSLRKGYAWDGPSGPTYDDATNMIPSLEHDAFYQLMSEGLLAQGSRVAVDRYFRTRLLHHGMGRLRAYIYFRSVRVFGGKYSARA